MVLTLYHYFPHHTLYTGNNSLQPCTHLPEANLYHGNYKYTTDLTQLSQPPNSTTTPSWPEYQSPINLEALLAYLDMYPDKAFAKFIGDGFQAGFRIGYMHPRVSDHLRPRQANHPSSLANPLVVTDRIIAEKAAGRLLGPLSRDQSARVHTSPLGLVPKSHQSNKWRMICDLSSPSGHSVNDGIPRDLCSLQYASVDDAVGILQRLGRGTQLIKLDIQDAYRIVPVHPSNYSLLGINWNRETYIDRALPFGLRSAPKIFNAVADLIAWALTCNGIQYQLHYLDDFLFFAAPNSPQGPLVLSTALKTLHQLGIPVATHKTEGPTSVLIFLGILIDTDRFELRLPTEKLLRLQEMIKSWTRKHACQRKELECLLGHLCHAATVIHTGRTFLRNLFPLLALDRAPHHYIRLNTGARADLLWWSTFLKDWNGRSFFPSKDPLVEVTSDASGNFGCGGFWPGQGWFQVQWRESWLPIHITAKELLPIVIAAALWGHRWSQQRVRFTSDNSAVVCLLNSLSSPDMLLMHLLRCLSFYAAYYRFTFEAAHIPGIQNVAADAISRNNIPLFLSLQPQATQVTVPRPIMELLVTKQPDWGSHTWTHLFKASLTEGLPNPPGSSISPDGENM